MLDITLYHVANQNYSPGQDLYCANDLGEQPSNWHDEYNWGLDGDKICFYETYEDAKEHQEYIDPNGKILKVTLEYFDDTNTVLLRSTEQRITRVEEGYPAISGPVPAEAIEIIT